MKKLNIKEAIEIVADDWDNVKQETIKNCWLSTGILPAEMTLVNADNMETDEADNDIVELISALDSLSIAEPSIDSLTANEYIEIDNNLVSAELPTDEELVEEILLAEGVLHPTQVDMEDSSEEEEASISVKVGREALVTARKFLEQREFTTESDIRYIRNINIIKRLDEAVEMSKRQTSLTTPRVSVLFCTHVTFTVTPLHFWPINDCVANLFFAVTHLSLFLTSSYLHIS